MIQTVVPAGTDASFENRPTELDEFDYSAEAHESDVIAIKDLHAKLRASASSAVLVVLLAVDTGGKDPTIDEVFGRVALRGIRVAHFGSPTSEEGDHDFLWRVHAEVPRRGEISIFNRSHYDAIVEPVTAGDITWDEAEARGAHIRAFEDLLVDSGTTVLKFFLHLSREEQARRITERLDDPDQRWEFDVHDVDVHQQWDAFHDAFGRAIAWTSTERAPWHIVPADDGFQRNAIVAKTVRDALEQIDPSYPEPAEDLDGYRAVLVGTDGD